MRELIFFSGGLDPVLNCGERDENSVIAPKVPRRRPIRQAIFDHETYSQTNDALSIVTSQRRKIREIGTEVDATGFATMFRVNNVQVERSVATETTEIVKRSLAEGIAIATTTTLWTAPPTVIPRTVFDQRSG
jgi:hypothetical protein